MESILKILNSGLILKTFTHEGVKVSHQLTLKPSLFSYKGELESGFEKEGVIENHFSYFSTKTTKTYVVGTLLVKMLYIPSVMLG